MLMWILNECSSVIFYVIFSSYVPLSHWKSTYSLTDQSNLVSSFFIYKHCDYIAEHGLKQKQRTHRRTIRWKQYLLQHLANFLGGGKFTVSGKGESHDIFLEYMSSQTAFGKMTPIKKNKTKVSYIQSVKQVVDRSHVTVKAAVQVDHWPSSQDPPLVWQTSRLPLEFHPTTQTTQSRNRPHLTYVLLLLLAYINLLPPTVAIWAQLLSYKAFCARPGN